MAYTINIQVYNHSQYHDKRTCSYIMVSIIYKVYVKNQKNMHRQPHYHSLFHVLSTVSNLVYFIPHNTIVLSSVNIIYSSVIPVI